MTDAEEVAASGGGKLTRAYHRLGGRLATALAFKVTAALIVILELLLAYVLKDNPLLQNLIVVGVLAALGLLVARYMEADDD